VKIEMPEEENNDKVVVRPSTASERCANVVKSVCAVDPILFRCSLFISTFHRRHIDDDSLFALTWRMNAHGG
jgi:hypothetical protein